MGAELNRAPLVEGEDFYWEGAVMVFTARFLLRRGYCCENGCRNCPYREPPRPDGAGRTSDDDETANGTTKSTRR
jgi:hypothetical protein